MDQREYLEKGQAILRRFHELTYEAFFVGGVVRDYVLKCDFKIICFKLKCHSSSKSKYYILKMVSSQRMDQRIHLPL